MTHVREERHSTAQAWVRRRVRSQTMRAESKRDGAPAIDLTQPCTLARHPVWVAGRVMAPRGRWLLFALQVSCEDFSLVLAGSPVSLQGTSS